ncbi:hypothetical protein BCR44DRAFT_1115966 [Catenaria anguillulae PL171]|uniref:Uncharacterized protein n=1 Tax=Catenaria anguillulae PL171 TaxID=765915 RepID=A0A1Y2HM58_9FUNG|nr:hypothetical protein BCR44DRAFT_1115966 [Catenaria anguillulae PL171]
MSRPWIQLRIVGGHHGRATHEPATMCGDLFATSSHEHGLGTLTAFRPFNKVSAVEASTGLPKVVSRIDLAWCAHSVQVITEAPSRSTCNRCETCTSRFDSSCVGHVFITVGTVGLSLTVCRRENSNTVPRSGCVEWQYLSAQVRSSLSSTQSSLHAPYGKEYC